MSHRRIGQAALLLATAAQGFGCGGETPPVTGDVDARSRASDAATSDRGEEQVARLEIVGHSPLLGRGMNSAIAIAGDHAYIGSRTDGATHTDAGVLIVDISDPTAPEVAGQIGAPQQALQGMSSRELRMIPGRELLMVLNFACGNIHDCTLRPVMPAENPAAETDNLRFYDVSNPTAPVLVSRVSFGTTINSLARPHELFVWSDPADPGRVLAFVATPRGPPGMMVLDVSDPLDVSVITTWDPHLDGGLPEARTGDNLLHSVGVSADGETAYLSHLQSGMLFVDTRSIARADAQPSLSLLHAMAARVDWSPPEPSGPHSAVEVPGRDLVVVTDEVYPPEALAAGCPWGWLRIVDHSNPRSPRLAGEYKLAENDPSFCANGNPAPRVAFTAHNTTATEHLAFVTWHSGGLQVVDISDPDQPHQLTELRPTPISSVQTEDPVLGGDGLTMWSYPIIRDGLIYVVDIRNGLYILRYTGPHEDEVASRAYLEGNSNRGR